MSDSKQLEIKQVKIGDLKPAKLTHVSGASTILLNFAKDRKNTVIGGHFRLKITKNQVIEPGL